VGHFDDLVDLESRLEKVRASIDRLKEEEVRLARHLQIVRARPNIPKCLNQLGCSNIDTAQLRFSILEYVCSMTLGMTTEQIWQNLHSIYPAVSYGNVRVNLSGMSGTGLFKTKRRGGNWVVSALGKNTLTQILYGATHSFNAEESSK
jgi:hypothetical protein